jgi:cell division septum initiation protein DivIVA
VSTQPENRIVSTDAPQRRPTRRPHGGHSNLYSEPQPRGPRFRAPAGNGATPQAEAAMAGRLSYVRALETQVGTLTETVSSLEQRVAAYEARNRELEASYANANGAERAAIQDMLRQAEETLTVAEAQVRSLQERAQREAGEIVGKAQVQANEMIATVTAEIAEIESGAQAAAQSAEADALRGQIRDLMRLRESILTSIRTAVNGFNEQLDNLGEPLFESAEVAPSPSAAPATDEPASMPTDQFEVSVIVRPVDGVIEASTIERSFVEAGAAARLLSVEGTTAEYAVSGVSPDHLRAAADRVFPSAQSEWVAADRMQVVLAPATTP